VKHTHDLDLAGELTKTMVAESCDGAPDDILLSGVKAIWCRIVHALPSSWAAAEGCSWSYVVAAGPGRGVIRAVEIGVAGFNPNSIGGAA
jgi:hypothetical protein